MFCKESFIELSRKFVCVRLESFESEEHQQMVRTFLNGRFANTAFCLLAPDGKTRLSDSGRSPGQVLARRQSGEQEAAVLAAMARVVSRYPGQGDAKLAEVPDFHGFKQALNVASADQRLLVFAVVPGSKRAAVERRLKAVANHPEAIGRYHYDRANAGDEDWAKLLSGVTRSSGLMIVRADTFGQKGKVVASLPTDVNAATLLAALGRANRAFAAEETRKHYAEHVSEGRRSGVEYKAAMPWGEDRDADGKIDPRPGRAGRGGRRP